MIGNHLFALINLVLMIKFDQSLEFKHWDESHAQIMISSHGLSTLESTTKNISTKP